MPESTLPIADLPAWAHLNNVSFRGVKITNTEGKGYGVVCDADMKAGEQGSDTPSLLTVPHDLVLNTAAVEEYAKEDRNFKQLLDAVGRSSTRADVLLFLLIQTVLASRPGDSSAGVSNPWREYLQFLPLHVPVPTLWTEDERLLLRGTSLETAVTAKISALDAEFAHVMENSSNLPHWAALLQENDTVSFMTWVWLDALYRSRCLELPRSGESMVPCIDMINHSSTPSAYYEENFQDEVTILLRPGTTLSEDDEITISYGTTKPAAEMLFSYGFIDTHSTTASLTLPLAPFPDDPLAKAKLVAFGQAPKIYVAREEVHPITAAATDSTSTSAGRPVHWRSPFAHLMCVNEEDGLEFRVLQTTEGERQLRVFWQDDDVTERVGEFEALIEGHPLAAVLRLRVVTVMLEALGEQLRRLRASEVGDKSDAGAVDSSSVREECRKAAMALRGIESGILEEAIGVLEEERSSLLADKNVVAYLGLTEAAESGLAGEEASNEPDDFS